MSQIRDSDSLNTCWRYCVCVITANLRDSVISRLEIYRCCFENAPVRAPFVNKDNPSVVVCDSSIVLGPSLFRLVNLSGGNCLIWRLLRISDSGSKIHVSVQPSDTLSHYEWKLCEMCVSQKHISHESFWSISRDTCSLNHDLMRMKVCLQRTALFIRL